MKLPLFLVLWLVAWPVYAQLRLPDAEAVAEVAAAGDTTALASLLDRGGSVEERNSKGWTPLICAIEKHQLATVRLLLARHADPNAPTEKNCTPLDFAAGEGLPDAATLLLEAGAEINDFHDAFYEGHTRSALFVALANHRLDLARLLLARGAKLDAANNRGDTALMDCCRRRSADEVAFLIAQGANVNVQDRFGHSALIYAAYNGNEEAVRLLLAHGANVHATAMDEDGPRYSALEAATQQGWPFILEMLVDAGASEADSRWALNRELNAALNLGDYERAQAALAKGASATEPDGSDVKPLAAAVLKGDPSIVALLIKAGADVHASLGGDPPEYALGMAVAQSERAKTPAQKERFQRTAALLRKAGAAR